MKFRYCITVLLLLLASQVSAAVLRNVIVVNMHMVTKEGVGPSIGTIELRHIKQGVLITPNLKGLSPGLHGFHLHVNPSCADFGKAAGPHFDPHDTKQHLGPMHLGGHQGDLPVLFANRRGDIKQPEIAPKIEIHEMVGHALMIHMGEDNYKDVPKKLGGGGARVACGVVK